MKKLTINIPEGLGDVLSQEELEACAWRNGK